LSSAATNRSAVTMKPIALATCSSRSPPRGVAGGIAHEEAEDLDERVGAESDERRQHRADPEGDERFDENPRGLGVRGSPDAALNGGLITLGLSNSQDRPESA